MGGVAAYDEIILHIEIAMKLNLRALMTSGIAIATLIALPTLIKAFPAQALPPQALESLNLTEQQQAELDTLQANVRDQLEDILTADQRTSLQTSLDSGTPFRQAVRSLNLSEDQKQQARSIMQASRDDFQAVLTEEQQQQLQAARGDRRRGEGGRQALANLNLTDAQQAEIDIIRANTRSQVEAALTEEQRSALQGAATDEGGFRQAMRDLDLSETQRTEIREIMQSSRESVGNVLTEDQKQQLQEMRQGRRESRQGRRGRDEVQGNRGGFRRAQS